MRRPLTSILGIAILSLLSAGGSPADVMIYAADLDAEQVQPVGDNEDPLGSVAMGFARMELDLDSLIISMSYEISFIGLSLEDDITAVHFHRGHREGARLPRHGEYGVNGPHVLNVYGFPRQDDDDLVVDLENNTLRGIWDNTDRNFGPDGVYQPSDSVGLGEVVPDLFEEEIYIQVHTVNFPGGEIRGQLYLIPEPEGTAMIVIASCLTLLRRRRA